MKYNKKNLKGNYTLYFQDVPMKKRRLQYDRANIPRAYEATQAGMTVYKAARLYNVPESTLRDRTRGNVAVDAKNGTGTLMSTEEEQKLVEHIKYMANIGYGYTKSNIQYMARDYAEAVGKTVKGPEALSNCWFYGFMGRWPELKTVKPQKLAIARAKSASRDAINKYYQELGTILTSNNLTNKPGRIYNIDETGISTEHTPPRIICDKDTNPQSVTSPRGSTVTVIAGGNALGNNIPPYYVFPGVRWNDSLLSGASVGAAGEMSKSGWSSSDVFRNYLTKHFATYANISSGTDGEPTLVLYDGHRSHISLTLTEWAKAHNVVLFVLPPHTSHLTQPLDVGVFGPFKAMYNKECQTYMNKNPGLTITRYQVAELTANPYLKSLTPENLTAAFRKTGIYPFDNKVIFDSQVAPAVIYPTEQNQQTSDNSNSAKPSEEKSQEPPPQEVDQPPQEVDQPSQEVDQPTNSSEPVSSTAKPLVTPASFFQERTITVAVKNRTKRKFVPPVLTGNLMKKSVTHVLTEIAAKKKHTSTINTALPEKSKSAHKKIKSNKINSTQTGQTTKKSNKPKVLSLKPKKSSPSNAEILEPVPSTSGLNSKGGPIDLCSNEDSHDSSDYSSDNEDQTLCCVCDATQPEAFKKSDFLKLLTWAKCDYCTHWTHLQFCTEVRVIRRGDIFRCPHCLMHAH